MKWGRLSRLALAVVLLLAAASALSGCRGARAGDGPLPATPDADGPRPLLLTGELAAIRSADLFVPETPLWELQLRFLEEDGAVVKAGDRVAEFDAGNLASELEQKRIAAIEAETELVRFDADREVAELGREQTVRSRRRRSLTAPDRSSSRESSPPSARRTSSSPRRRSGSSSSASSRRTGPS